MNNSVWLKEIDFNSFEATDFLLKSDFIYTTKEWINFLVNDNKGEPIIVKIVYKTHECCFVGLIFKKFGVKICGSPFEGWSSPYMGIIGSSELLTNEKALILKELKKFIFRKKRVLFFQFSDWSYNIDFAKNTKFKYDILKTPFVDLSLSEEELFSGFKTDVRTNCRNFLKRGAFLKTVDPTTEFANDYYLQLVEVFKKQNLVSFYSLEKIENLMSSFSNSKNMILCENVYEPNENKSIATGIFLGYKKRCYFFGAASFSEYQILRPNEYVIWNAIKYWKSKGCIEFDMCGTRKYKEKFSPKILEFPVFYFSKIPGLLMMKKIAKKIVLKSRKK